jgi:diguanylate cyclase (GGDEF)-like protein/PAS domain S-box-containing protein
VIGGNPLSFSEKEAQNLDKLRESSAQLPADSEPDRTPSIYSEINYRSLFDNHPDLVFTLNRDGVVLEVNQRIEILGYKPEEVNKPFSNFIHKKELQKNFDKFLNELGGSSENYDTVLIKKDGTPTDVNVTAVPIKTDHGIIGVFGIIKDTSESNRRKKELESIRNSLNLAQFTANIGSWDYNVVSSKLFWSNQLYRILGIENTNDYVPTIQKYIDFVHPKDSERYLKLITHSWEKKQDYQTEYQIRRTDGKERYIFEKARAIVDNKGDLIRFIGIVQDITQKKLTEERLKENEVHLQMVHDNLDVAIWSFNLETKQFQYLSAGIERISGYPSELFYTNKNIWNEIVHPDDLREFLFSKERSIRGESVNIQFRIIHRDGNIRWVQDHTIPYINQSGKTIRLYGISSDITSQKEAEAELSFLANHDYLTKLVNRRYFDKKLSAIIKEKESTNEPFAVLYFDLDRFKQINDSFGHLIGDELLKRVSTRLSQLLSKDQVLARMGGDEFAMIIPHYDNQEHLIDLVKEIINQIKIPFSVDNFELYVTTSIGISIYPQDGTTSEELIKSADMALYRAKELGKDNYQFHLHESKNNMASKEINEKAIRKALSKNEFRVFYQPKVDLETMEIVGAEALIRWEHPELGHVLPGLFIPFAEESNLIVEIGEWMIRSVCLQINTWKSEGRKKIPISINLSAKSLLKNNWNTTLLKIIEETNVDPGLLEFEITENTILQNDEVVQKSIDLIRELGIKVSLDDFGTGFSSITNLKQYLFDFLKIDRSFIQNMERNLLDALLTESIIDLSHRLKMKVVAEGVETLEQLKMLDQYGCDSVQGYLFSKPVNLKMFEDLLDHGVLIPKETGFGK